MLFLEICRCLWSLFLAFFRSKPDVLPLSSEKTRPVGLLQRRGRGSSLASSGRSAGSHPRSNPHGHPQSRAYPLILPDRHFGPPPRPPPVSEDEFSTTPDVHLPSVIVTPCTPSKASRTCIRLDELDSDDSSASDDPNSSITSVDSNPFLSDPPSPLQKGTRLPRLGPHRARSLTGTSRGLYQYHQRPSRGHNQFSLLAVAVTNPVKKSDPVGPSTSFIRSRTDLNFVWDSITDKRIRSYTTTKSADQHVASARRSEDPKGSVTASTGAQPALLDATVITPSVHGHAQPSVVPYAEVFDFDAYFDSDSSLPSESTLKSSLSSTTDSSESKDSFPLTSPSFRSPLRRISNISDTTTASSTYSLSAMSTDMDESPSSHSPRIADGKSKVTFDHEVKRYRDHYRPPAYSRSPAFVIESPTTSRKFTGRRESGGISIKTANKEIAPTTTLPSTSTAAVAKLSDTSPPSHVGDTSTTGLPSTFRTSDSSTTTASLSPAGKNHRLGPVAISQRRKM